MARNDVRPRDTGGFNVLPTLPWGVAAGTPVTVKAGEPTKVGTLPNVVLEADAGGTASQLGTGVAAADSTETASAAGTVDCYYPASSAVYECAAKTASAADTTSEIIALKLKRVIWDLTSSTFTIDTAAADATTNGLLIVGGDPNRSVIYFIIRSNYAFTGNVAT